MEIDQDESTATTPNTTTSGAPNRDVLPGFTLSTRTSSSRVPWGQDKDQDEVNKRIANWLRDWLLENGTCSTVDNSLHPYKGWKIDSPRIQLSRAKNFLSDEDVDRTLDWPRKFAELAEYFAYLLKNYQGEDWGTDLYEAINMLHTHWVFEQHHYGRPKLDLTFLRTIPRWSKRLSNLPGSEVIFEGKCSDTMGERKLLHQKIQPGHDCHYDMPREVLERYLLDFETDTHPFWDSMNEPMPREDRLDDDTLNEEDQCFNMAFTENAMYDACMGKGLTTTLHQLDETGPFIFDAEADLVEKPNGMIQPTIDSLRGFSEFRGARRAALQQCLNQFNSYENIYACNSWRTLALPEPEKPAQKHAGLIIPTVQVSDVPKEASRDPFSYTLAFKWFLEAENKWSQFVSGEAMEDTNKLALLRKKGDDNLTEIPASFRAPYGHDDMDSRMRDTREFLKRCRCLHAGLKRASRKAPREFITDVLRLVQEGIDGKDWKRLDLAFSGEPQQIQDVDEDALAFLSGPSVNGKMIGVEDTPSRETNVSSTVFASRVREMMNDISPQALFVDTQPKEFDAFLWRLNKDCGSPVQRFMFHHEETLKEAAALAEQGLMTVYSTPNGIQVGRPLVDYHPEDRIQFFDYPDEDARSATSVDMEDIRNNRVRPVATPEVQDCRSWPQVILYLENIRRDMHKTARFFLGLAYRLGKTIRELEHDLALQEEKLTSKKRQENNDRINDFMTAYQDKFNTMPQDPEKIPASWRPMPKRNTPMLRDVVLYADPDAHKLSWGGPGVGQDKTSEAHNLVRKSILREAHENKSMLFPTRNKRSVGPGAKIISAPRLREPVWSFGHPARIGRAGLFFDMDRWPLHLQPEDSVEKIEPGEQTNNKEAAQEDDSDTVAPKIQKLSLFDKQKSEVEGADELIPDKAKSENSSVVPTGTVASYGDDTYQYPFALAERMDISWAERGDSRRRFTPGFAQYWLGETPRQKKAFEDYLRGSK